MGESNEPRRGLFDEETRRKLREIIAEEYRGTLRYGEPLILDGFIKNVRPVSAAIEFDFLPDPNAPQGE